MEEKQLRYLASIRVTYGWIDPALKMSDEQINELIRRYETMRCTGVVALIEQLRRPEGKNIVGIFSGTVGIQEYKNIPGLTEKERIARAWKGVRTVRMDNHRGHSLIKFFDAPEEVFSKIELLTPELRERFDGVYADFAILLMRMFRDTPRRM